MCAHGDGTDTHRARRVVRRHRICVARRHQASDRRRASIRSRAAPSRRARKIRDMTFCAAELEDGARAATGLDDFGSSYYREGLERVVEALNTEAELSDSGLVIQHATISNALIQRLKVEQAYAQHP